MAAEARKQTWVCLPWARARVRRLVHTEGGGVVGITVRQHLGGIQELLIAHVAFAAAEEDVGTLLPLDALATAKHTVICSSVQIFGILQ